MILAALSTGTEIVVAVLASSAVTALVNHLVTLKKSKQDTRKAKIEADSAEIDLEKKWDEWKNTKIQELINEVHELRREVASLKAIVEDKDLDDCQNKDCPNRNTKRKIKVK